jgi:hypothetical protein
VNQNSPDPQEQRNFVYAVTAIIALESIPLHFLISMWNPMAAWVVLALNVSTLAWLWWPLLRKTA